jgi:plasmid rolling circle replication initiator protein Rep
MSSGTSPRPAPTPWHIYASAVDLAKYGPKLRDCSDILVLVEHITADGCIEFHARSAKCRARHCPVCQRARVLHFVRQLDAALEPMAKAHPKGRWLFLTLTVRNCEIHDLRQTLQDMGTAWHRLVKRKEFAVVQGWLRSTEVTRADDGKAHPHFHALLFVPGYYFTGQYYIKHERWVSLWQKVARLDYAPTVYIKPIKTLQGGLTEVVKTAAYSIKVEDIEAEPDWFLEYHRQVHQLHFFAAGGLIKEYLAIDDKPADDIAEGEEQPEDEMGRKIFFGWQRPVKRYRKKS